MRKTYRLLGVIAAAALLAGCGGDNGDYSKYVTLGDYKNMSVDLVVEEVTDEELDEYQEEQLDEYVTYEEADGPVKEGQLVQVSLLAEVDDEAVYDFTEDSYDLIIGQQDFGAEVDDALLGGVVGDEFDFTVSYDEDFGDAMLCGKEVDYHIEILGVSDVIYPELTDEFVKENYGEQSVEDWRETLAEELKSDHQAEAEDNLRTNLVQQAVDDAQITGYPKELYKQKCEEIQSDYQSYADMFGCSVDEIYEMFELDEEGREQEYLDATYQTMVLAMIRQQENMNLSDEQLQEKLEEFAQDNEYSSVDELLADYDKENLRQYFLDEMTVDFLEEHANITTPEE